MGADVAVAVVVFVTALLLVQGPNDSVMPRSPADIPTGEFFVAAFGSGALVWRRRWPLAVLAGTLVASFLAVALGYSEAIALTLLVALYAVGRYVADLRWSTIGLVTALAVVMATSFVDDSTETEVGSSLFALSVVAGIWYIGRRMRVRGERAALRRREQAAEARQAVAEERTRIARELHDVVAHRVSLMTVQAGAAKTVAADDPDGALRAMEAVEKAGRQVLSEMRHLLGVLRPEADEDGPSPQPALADLPRLVAQFEEAGLDVSLQVTGDRTDLPATVDLSAYRVVQEALTNVLKHAGPGTRTEVRLSIDAAGITIGVLDDGHGASVLPGSGHGILGMRERAQLLGGSLDAGPRAGGGFAVVARLPLRSNQA